MYSEHHCPKCNNTSKVLSDGRVLKDYEWCEDCKDEHRKKDWAVRWFNHRFHIFTKLDIYMRDGFKCYLCNEVLEFKNRNTTFDHVIPVARGGFSTFDNLKLCCNRCNNKKADLLLEEVFAEYGTPDQWD